VNLNYSWTKENLNYCYVKRFRSQLFNTQVVADSITIRFACSGSCSGFGGGKLLFGLQPCEEGGKKEETKLASGATAASKDGTPEEGSNYGYAHASPAGATTVQQLRPGRSHETLFLLFKR